MKELRLSFEGRLLSWAAFGILATVISIIVRQLISGQLPFLLIPPRMDLNTTISKWSL